MLTDTKFKNNEITKKLVIVDLGQWIFGIIPFSLIIFTLRKVQVKVSNSINQKEISNVNSDLEK